MRRRLRRCLRRCVGRLVEQVVGQDMVMAREAERRRIERQPAGAVLARPQIDHDENAIAGLRIVPRPGEEVRVVDLLHQRRPVAGQRRFGAPEFIEPGDERRQALRSVEIPARDLVLLRIEILLAARLARRHRHQFQGRAVDPPVAHRQRRQRQPDEEHRPAPGLERLVEDVGRVGPEVGAEEVGDGRARDLGEVGGELGLLRPPGEVGVGLREAELGEPVHRLRPRERLGQKDRVGGGPPDVGDQPFPK